MKKLLKNLGLFILIGGVSYLGYIVYTGIQTNLTLAISAAIILGGFLFYIVINKAVS